MSVLSTALCLGVSISLWQVPLSGDARLFASWPALIPLTLIFGCALFCIRGYTLSPEMLTIRRLLWNTQIHLTDLISAESRPEAMHRSIRTFGNGGFFSFTGYYRNRNLGSYIAFVTDPHQTVILRFPTRTIVLSPDEPEVFANEISSYVRNFREENDMIE